MTNAAIAFQNWFSKAQDNNSTIFLHRADQLEMSHPHQRQEILHCTALIPGLGISQPCIKLLHWVQGCSSKDLILKSLHGPPGLTFSNSTVRPHNEFTCFVCGSQNKQRLFPYQALSGLLL
jgi:hypothetical protein